MTSAFGSGAFGGGGSGGGSQGPPGPQGPSGGASTGLRYSCPGGTTVRQLVAIAGANTVALADASDAAARPAFAFVAAVNGSGRCDVQYAGELGGFSGLTPGTYYRISTTPGAVSTSPPAGSGVEDQIVGLALDTTTMLVSVDQTVFLTP